MRFKLIITGQQFDCRITAETRIDLLKLYEIIASNPAFQFRGDPEFAEKIRKQLAHRRSRQQTGDLSPEEAQWLHDVEKLVNKAEQSIKNDPNDTQNFSDATREMREEHRRDKRIAMFGEDLPGAHKNLLAVFKNIDDMQPPFDLDMDEDEFLAFVELSEAWLEKHTAKKGAAPPASDEEDAAEEPSVPSPESLFLKQIQKIIQAMRKEAGTVRERKLIKIQTRKRGISR